MSTRSKGILLIFGLVVLVAGLWLIMEERSAPVDKSASIHVGAVLPLTGPAAQIGGWQRRGLQVALEHLNEDGGVADRKIEAVLEDSQSIPAAGVSAFQKVMLEMDVPVVFSSLSSVSSAILPIADERHVNLMMLAVSLPEITERSAWAFRCNLGSDDEARAMAKYLEGSSVKRVAVAYLNDEFGVGAVQVFKREAGQRNITVTIAEPYAAEDADLRSLALKLRQTQADAIYVIGFVNSSIQLIKQLRELGVDAPILGNMALSVPSFLELGGEALHGARFTVSQYDPLSPLPQVRRFVETYEKRFGETPNFFSAFTYDAMRMVAEAMRSHGLEADGIRTGLLALNNFSGVLGDLTVGPTGDIDYPTQVVVNQNGEIRPIEEE